jgi:hypothetical protein
MAYRWGWTLQVSPGEPIRNLLLSFAPDCNCQDGNEKVLKKANGNNECRFGSTIEIQCIAQNKAWAVKNVDSDERHGVRSIGSGSAKERVRRQNDALYDTCDTRRDQNLVDYLYHLLRTTQINILTPLRVKNTVVDRIMSRLSTFRFHAGRTSRSTARQLSLDVTLILITGQSRRADWAL